MQTSSAKFARAILNDHVVVSKVEFWSSTGTSPLLTIATTDTSTTAMRIIDGTVTFDKHSAIRSQFSLKLIDPYNLYGPSSSSNLLTPYGNQVVIYRGIDFQDGSAPEYIQLGKFRLSTVTFNDTTGGLTVSLTGYDLSRIVQRRSIDATYWPVWTPPGVYPYDNAPYTTFVRGIILDRYPSAVFNDSEDAWAALQNDPSILVPMGVRIYLNFGEDPWGKGIELMTAVGCDIYADRYGVFTAARDPAFAYTSTPVVVPVATYVEGQTMIFDEADLVLTDETAFNRCIVTGEGTPLNPTPLRSAPADDVDPTSPTYINGDYGVVPHMVTNSYMFTQFQIDDYAQLILRSSVGIAQTGTLVGMVDPRLDIDDVVAVTRARLGWAATQYVIDKFTCPLTATGKANVALRQRRVMPS